MSFKSLLNYISYQEQNLIVSTADSSTYIICTQCSLDLIIYDKFGFQDAYFICICEELLLIYCYELLSS